MDEMQHLPAKPCVLAIGGLDPSGGAGLPADSRAIAAFGAHACPVATAVIAQNTRGVARFEPVSPEMLQAQLDNLLEDIAPQAVKIGMLPCVESVKVVSRAMGRLSGIPIVVDPVFAPSSGPAFSGSATIAAILNELLPLAEMVTPNLVEAGQILVRSITDLSLMREAAVDLGHRCKSGYVLLKGGHLPGGRGQPDDEWAGEAIDILFDCQAGTLTTLSRPRIEGYEVRGTGCMLASAIAAQRAQGVPVPEAAEHAKEWLSTQIAGAITIGSGRRVAPG